jgi:hypothetical protein
MGTIYAPFKNNKPVTFEVNGHSVVIVASQKRAISESLNVLGGDTVKAIRVADHTKGIEQAVEKLFAKKLPEKGLPSSVVFAPNEVDMNELLFSLQRELPWIH